MATETSTETRTATCAGVRLAGSVDEPLLEGAGAGDDPGDGVGLGTGVGTGVGAGARAGQTLSDADAPLLEYERAELHLPALGQELEHDAILPPLEEEYEHTVLPELLALNGKHFPLQNCELEVI